MRNLILTWLILTAAGPVGVFDQDHRMWNALLARHVVLVSGGNASRVDYARLLRDRTLLNTYTAQLSAVAPEEFESWGNPEQEAFLINAYNAFTLELILTRYPDLKSIKDLGGWLSSPWIGRLPHAP